MLSTASAEPCVFRVDFRSTNVDSTWRASSGAIHASSTLPIALYSGLRGPIRDCIRRS